MNATSPFRAGQVVMCVDDTGTLLVSAGRKYQISKIDRHMLILYRANPGYGYAQHMRADRFRALNQGE